MTDRIAYVHPSIWKDMAGRQRYVAYFGDFEFPRLVGKESRKKYLTRLKSFDVLLRRWSCFVSFEESGPLELGLAVRLRGGGCCNVVVCFLAWGAGANGQWCCSSGPCKRIRLEGGSLWWAEMIQVWTVLRGTGYFILCNWACFEIRVRIGVEVCLYIIFCPFLCYVLLSACSSLLSLVVAGYLHL